MYRCKHVTVRTNDVCTAAYRILARAETTCTTEQLRSPATLNDAASSLCMMTRVFQIMGLHLTVGGYSSLDEMPVSYEHR